MGIHSRPTNGISLCAGAGGLDVGVMLCEPGFHTRAYVEWEEYPRQAIIATRPYLSPALGLDDCLAWASHVAQTLEITPEKAIESYACRMVNGMAARSRALRLLGNGVHPLAAANAIRALCLAHGLRPVDLEDAS